MALTKTKKLQLSTIIKEIRIILGRKKYFFLAIVFFGVVYSLISLVNHYYFRTYALDLGLYTQALYKYARFQLADSNMVKDFYEPLLGGHFDLYLIIFSSLSFIFGTNTLLIVQIVAILSGGVGVYKLFDEKEKNTMAVWAMLYFYLFFGIFSAVSFDYHSVVVASCLVPWFFYTIKHRKTGLAAMIFFLLLISQENVSLWIFFVCLGLAIEYRREIKTLQLLLAFSGIALIYFVSVILFIIPAFSEAGKYGGFLYTNLGDTPGEALITLVTNPTDAVRKLFFNHTGNVYGDYVKLEFHISILFSGVYLLFRKPAFLLMLVPLYAQKLFHDSFRAWGTVSQYVVEFTPILAIGAFSVLTSVKRKPLKHILLFILMAGTLAATIKVMDNPVLYSDKTRIQFYNAPHYSRTYNVEIVHEQLNRIPKDARVSALSPFVPHLALRDHIYQFPIIKDAEYIIYSGKENTYPMKKDEFKILTNQLENSTEWTIEFKNEDFTILKRLVNKK